MSFKLKTNLVTTVATIASTAILSGPAFAQSGATEANTYLDEVVVTAQRRGENNLQDVPIAITAANAEMLSELRLDNIEDVTILTPSVTFRKTNSPSSSSNIRIRGIGTTGQSRTFEGAVGVFIDGVYRTRSGQALSNFLDIDSLEVLRGPQGTLFGKNTSAGAILLSSANPTFDGTTGFIEAAAGNYNAYDLKGALNFALSDQFAVRFAASHSQSDGYLERPDGDSENDLKANSFKASALYEPNDSFSIKLTADYSKQDDECCYGTVDYFDDPTITPFFDALATGLGNALPSSDFDDYQANLNVDTVNEVVDKGLALNIEWDVLGGTVNAITGLREYDTFQFGDADFTAADVLNIEERFNSKFFSQEITYNNQISGDFNADFLVGLFYSDEDLDMGRSLFHGTQAQTFWDVSFTGVLPAGFVNAAPGQWNDEGLYGTAKSLAAFTHWDFELSDQLNLTVGARYSKDDKTGELEMLYMRDPILDPFAVVGTQPGVEYNQDFDGDAVSGTLSLQYKPTDSSLIYASYNRGYKSGGVSIDANASGTPGSSLNPADMGVRQDPGFNSETVDAFELGAKFDWLDGRARTNVSLFHNEIEDLQIAQFLGLIFTVINSPEATVTGAEIEHTHALNDIFTLNASATFLPTAEYGEDASIGGLSGRRFSIAPKFAASAALNFDYDIRSNAALIGFLQLQHSGEVYTNSASNLTQDALTLVNANAGLSFDNGVAVTAFVRNLTDERYTAQHFNTPIQGSDRNSYVGAPRTYGIALKKSF